MNPHFFTLNLQHAAFKILSIAILSGLLVTPEAQAQRWQWPEKAQNLKVLPADASPEILRGAMSGFVQALGVRCNHCHVGEDGQPLSTFDFASDEKHEKNAARVMMQMTRTINSQFISQITEGHENKTEVSCVTCHQGQPEPRTLEQVLTKVIDSDGVDSAIVKYRELRARFYGGFTYDFREGPLNTLGYERLGKGDLEGATKLFKLNVEMNPESANAHDSLGEAYMKAGEKALAISHYEKSLELNPRNRNATRMLEELKK